MASLFGRLGIDLDWHFTLSFASLIMTRIVMVTTTIPFLVGKPVPPQIRIGLAMALVVFLYPFLAPADHSLMPAGLMPLAVLYLKESFYGIAIGISSSIIFHGFEAAGSMIDNQRGAAQARLLIPQLGEQTSIFGQFYFLMGVTIFLSIGGHLFFFKALIESYDSLPILTLPQAMPDMLAMTDEMMRLTGTVLLLAIQLCAPVLISIFVADVILGIMSRTAPAINVWELGFAIRGLLGVVIPYLGLGILVSQMGSLSMGTADNFQRVLRFLTISPGQPL